MASTSRRIKGRDRLIVLASGSEVTAQTGTATYVAVPVATQLAVITQPAGALDGAAFATQPVIELRSTGGAAVLQPGVTITASIVAGAGTPVGAVSAVTASDGRATYSNLGIDASAPPGSFTVRFTVTAGATGVSTVDSAPFTVAAGGALWPNEPSGMTLISDYGFTDTIAAGNDQPIGSSGWLSRNASGLMSRVADTDPASADGFAVNMSYPIGFPGGDDPGTIWRNIGSGTNELFLGIEWKPSNPWEDHPSGIGKIWFQFAGGGGSGGQCYIAMMSDRTLRFVTEFPSEATTNRNRNVGSGVATLGAWNKIEWYMRRNTGVVQVWLNGSLHINYNNVVYPSQAWDESKGAPTWGGGTGPTKSENDYYRYGHIRLLKRA